MTSDLLHYLDETEQEQFELLRRLVLQSSYTTDKAGVDRAGTILRQALSECDLELFIERSVSYGDNLIFQSTACRSKKPHILLVGHIDTVFPPESSFNTYHEDHLHAYGPGVCDMKGGLVSVVYLLKALQSRQLLRTIPIVFICNSDEETGSPDSAELIRRYAGESCCALVFECGGTAGEIVTGRKGKCGYRLEVRGKAGHAGFLSKAGKASAVLELAHKTILLERLNDADRQMVVNVGRIEAGIAPNVIAEKGWAAIDTRFLTREDGLFLKNRVEQIAAESTTAGTFGTVTTTNSRVPMEESQANLALYDIFSRNAALLEIPLQNEIRSGVSDANTAAECGIPVIDGLGPIGALDHSEDEYIVKSSVVQRCKLATLAVLEIGEKRSKGGLLQHL